MMYFNKVIQKLNTQFRNRIQVQANIMNMAQENEVIDQTHQQDPQEMTSTPLTSSPIKQRTVQMSNPTVANVCFI